MFIVGFNVTARVALDHDHEEVIRFARAAAWHLSGRSLSTEDFRASLEDRLGMFGSLEVEFFDPEGGELEFPHPDDYVVIGIRTLSNIAPTIH